MSDGSGRQVGAVDPVTPGETCLLEKASGTAPPAKLGAGRE